MKNKFKHIIFKDYTTYLDDYFAYLKDIKPNLPCEMKSFFCEEERYAINHDFSLHDAWIESLVIKNEYLENNKKTYIQLVLLLANHDKKVILNYRNVFTIIYDGKPSRWVNKAVDLLMHELHITQDGNYQHIIEFDSDIWLTIEFTEFSYEFLNC